MTTEEPGPYTVSRKPRGGRRPTRPRPGTPRPSAGSRPALWIVYRGEAIEIVGVFADPVQVLDALCACPQARVMRAGSR